MNISYKPLVLAVGILLWGNIESMDRLYSLDESVQDIALKIRSSGQNTVDDDRYVATVDTNKIAIAREILSTIQKQRLHLINTSNMQLVEDKEYPFIDLFETETRIQIL